jgi:DNA-binding IclR family transcriptional regulator
MATPVVIHAVDRALDIIEFLYRFQKEASISEISAGTGMFASTVHRQLGTLKARSYVCQNADTAKYGLGLRLYALGNAVKDRLPLANLIDPHADQVAKKYRLTVFVAVPDYSSSFCAQQAIIYKKSYSNVILCNEVSVGAVLMCHGSATGKCLMSRYPDALIEQYCANPLPKLTLQTISDWDALKLELEKIRNRGYALDSEEEELGKTCIAVPILDSRRQVVASISLSGQTHSIFEHPVNEITSDLNEVAKKIEGII